jgi:NADH dehydrogenase
VPDAARIAVTGATGFVGRHVVRTLLSRGHRIVALVRSERRLPFPADSNVEAVRGSIGDADALDRLTAGAQALIHLVGIIVERGRNTFQAVHVDGTGAVVAAARRAGIARLVHMSALGARDEPGATPYHRTKWRAERLALDAGLATTVLRPSLISGAGNVPIQTLARLHRFLPVVPLFGAGDFPVQPVWIDDVALACALAVESPDYAGVFELGGPAVMSYAAFVRAIGRAAGHLAPITSAQLQMLVEGNATPNNALPEAFKITPMAFEEGLRRYLAPNAQPRGRSGRPGAAGRAE